MSGSSWATGSFEEFERDSRERFEAAELRHAEAARRAAEDLPRSLVAMGQAVRDSLVAAGFLNAEPTTAESREPSERSKALVDENAALRAALTEVERQRSDLRIDLRRAEIERDRIQAELTEFVAKQEANVWQMVEEQVAEILGAAEVDGWARDDAALRGHQAESGGER